MSIDRWRLQKLATDISVVAGLDFGHGGTARVHRAAEASDKTCPAARSLLGTLPFRRISVVHHRLAQHGVQQRQDSFDCI